MGLRETYVLTLCTRYLDQLCKGAFGSAHEYDTPRTLTMIHTEAESCEISCNCRTYRVSNMRKARFFFALFFRPEETLISVWIRISFGHFSPFFSKWCGKARRNSDPHSLQNGATNGVECPSSPILLRLWDLSTYRSWYIPRNRHCHIRIC